MNDDDKSNEVEDEQNDAAVGVGVRYSVIVITTLVITVLAIAGANYLNRPVEIFTAPKPVSLPTFREELMEELPNIPFKDVTQESGITFRHVNGARGEKLLPETMGGGCAFLDYNADGHQDILLVNSKPWKIDVASPNASSLSLFENDGAGQFRDVTELAGLGATFYGQGCAVGDYDNDGDADLFISCVSEAESDNTQGPNKLYRNDGGKFIDITAEAGVAGNAGDWGSSCGWFDYDNDADLDLWVCNYVAWSREYDLAQNFRLTGGERAYGRPQAFGGLYPHLYRNDGEGKFTEVSKNAGIRVSAATTGTPQAKSLGLTFHDFDNDGNMDVLIANDTVQNNLFRNLGDGTFQEMAAIAGIAYDADGNARGAMGIDVACSRDDSRCACVAIGNFANEMTGFYVSAPGSLSFSDQAVANGLGPSTRLFLSFGVFFFDADLDGWDDIFHANGHLEQDISKVQSSQTYEQSPQLFWNAGPEAATEFVALPPTSTSGDFAAPMVGRGAAYADIDGDGDLDILIASVGAPCRLLRNEQQIENHWIRFRLTGNTTTTNRDAIGARVILKTNSGREVVKIVNPTRSYLSQMELPVTFGLGREESVESIDILWPDGSKQSITPAAVNQTYEAKQES